MNPKEKAIEYLQETNCPNFNSELELNVLKAIDIAIEETKKEYENRLCELCHEPDKYSEKTICKECFKKWQFPELMKQISQLQKENEELRELLEVHGVYLNKTKNKR